MTPRTETKITRRTVIEVSRTIGRSTAETAELLAELQLAGIAEETDGLLEADRRG